VFSTAPMNEPSVAGDAGAEAPGVAAVEDAGEAAPLGDDPLGDAPLGDRPASSSGRPTGRRRAAADLPGDGEHRDRADRTHRGRPRPHQSNRSAWI
jgi:hypothetical protein